MSDVEQPSLFGDPEMPPLQDIAETARKIAENAGKPEYPDRTSEAAREQGWGPVASKPETISDPSPTKYQTANERRAAHLPEARQALEKAIERSKRPESQ